MATDIQHDAESVRNFFNQWQIYKKVVDANYMFHREAYAAIASKLPDRPFSFLDLGAGDAQWTSRILAGRPVSRYHAVDLAAPALELARTNTLAFSGEKWFTQGDFVSNLPAEPFDVIFTGMSIHHLTREEKRQFIPRIRQLLNPGGRFLLYEVIRREEETREGVFARWSEYVGREWTALTPEEQEKIQAHVSSSDFQEPVADYRQFAKEAGFSRTEQLFVDPHDFYGAVCCDT